ncbi:hypothetical protein DBR22_11535 [Arthrobacter sp. HMWF013]|nr:hypothetical protein DBR22_11535 [Arthrobacter sp. HMWF013]
MTVTMKQDKNAPAWTPARPRPAATGPSDWKLSPITAGSTPQRGREPLLIRQWKYLWRNELVELRSGSEVLGSGYVDETTEDASTIWIHLTKGLGRVLIHRNDGIAIWRVDPRIYAHRVSPETQTSPQTAAGR